MGISQLRHEQHARVGHGQHLRVGPAAVAGRPRAARRARGLLHPASLHRGAMAAHGREQPDAASRGKPAQRLQLQGVWTHRRCFWRDLGVDLDANLAPAHGQGGTRDE